jgi:hypothetical protein
MVTTTSLKMGYEKGNQKDFPSERQKLLGNRQRGHEICGYCKGRLANLG